MEAEILKTDSLKKIIDNTPLLVGDADKRVDAAEKRGNQLLLEVQEKGMSDDMDKILNDYQVKVKKTYELINESRKPLTGLFDDIKKIFTGFESRIDPKSKDNIYSKIQAHRNDYAAKKAQEAARQRAEQERKLAIEKEKIEVRSKYELGLKQSFLKFIETQISNLIAMFNGLTLENFKEQSEKIKSFQDIYFINDFESIKAPFVSTLYLKPEELSALWTDVKIGKFDLFVAEFKKAINEKKDYYTVRINSKYRELHDIQQANPVDKERLEKQVKERETQEKQQQEEAQGQAEEQAILDAESKKGILTANTLFDMQSAEIVAPVNVREGYDITVTHPAGYQLIIAKYFEKEGLNQGIDALEKKTLGSMRKFCEKLALDSGETIESPYLVYKETFKAVVKK